MPDDEQPRLPMDLPEPVARPRRRRGKRVVRDDRGDGTLPLLRVPVIQRCGLCGRRQTVLGDVAVCSHCGSLIFRDDPE